MNFINLLASTQSPSTGATATNGLLPSTPLQYVLWIGALVALVAFWFLSSRSRTKQQQELREKYDSLTVGDKIKTIGLIMGEIVEVCEDNALIIKTGTETNYSYIKIDRQAVGEFKKLEQSQDNSEQITMDELESQTALPNQEEQVFAETDNAQDETKPNDQTADN